MTSQSEDDTIYIVMTRLSRDDTTHVVMTRLSRDDTTHVVMTRLSRDDDFQSMTLREAVITKCHPSKKVIRNGHYVVSSSEARITS
jgi:hypothetical protein